MQASVRLSRASLISPGRAFPSWRWRVRALSKGTASAGAEGVFRCDGTLVSFCLD
jgi:hypothetical protein